MMTEKQFAQLGRGDIVRNVSGESYVIVGLRPVGGFCAVREATVSNRFEWTVFSKSRRVEKKKEAKP